jgi:hypothetical protein
MMKRSSLLPVFLVLMTLSALSLSAHDWGLFFDQGFTGQGTGIVNNFSYSGSLVPWLSIPLSKNGRLYFSAGATAEYVNQNVFFIPELLITEWIHRIGENMEIKAGRMWYSDPLGFIAKNLFDGASLSLDIGSKGILSAGLWYTGLLYKKSARITMTVDDYISYNADLDYSVFMYTYFAPRRLLWALDWGNQDPAERLSLRTALIGQFDLSKNGQSFHSQYLTAKAGVPARDFTFELGACFELAESPGETKVSLAGEIGIRWNLPTPVQDQLSLIGRFSNGTARNGSFAAFVPITAEPQGKILQAKFSGLSMVRLAYTAQFHERLLFDLADSYFILGDMGTYMGLPAGRNGHFLGNEFYGSLTWTPISDLRIKLGGGVFLPSMGNADSQAESLWLAELNATLAIF